MTEERTAHLCAKLEPHEAALVMSGPGRLYLTGFSSSAGAVLLTAERAYFIIDFRYIEAARRAASSCEVLLQEKLYIQLNRLLHDAGVDTLYVETEKLEVSAFLRLQKELDDFTVSSDARLDGWMNEMRAAKSPEEVDCIREAQRMTDETFSHILNFIAPGRTEREIALEMEFYMRRLGSEGVSFDFIVVSGKNSSMPHGVPTEKRVERGDFVTMDFGAVCRGYRSDMTRTVAVGCVSEKQRTVYDTVLRAQNAALGIIRAGIRGGEVDAAARTVINEAGYNGCFGHSLGHAVGLEIHETPICAPGVDALLPVGTVMTVEPGVYIAGEFGVRIEDMVWLTEDGAENLTKSTKALLIL